MVAREVVPSGKSDLRGFAIAHLGKKGKYLFAPTHRRTRNFVDGVML